MQPDDQLYAVVLQMVLEMKRILSDFTGKDQIFLADEQEKQTAGRKEGKRHLLTAECQEQ